MPQSIADPNASAYGIYGPAYAQSMMQGGPNPGANILRQWALRNYAQAESGTYDEALRRTQEMQSQAAQAELESENLRALLPQLADMAEQGILGPVSQTFEGYLPGLAGSPVVTGRDQAAVDAVTAQARERSAGAGLDMARAGYTPEQPADLYGLPVADGYMTPEDAYNTTRANAYATTYADAATTNAQAALERARRPMPITSSSSTEGRWEQGPDGQYVYTPGTEQRTQTLTNVQTGQPLNNAAAAGIPPGEQRTPPPVQGLTPLGVAVVNGQLVGRYRNAQGAEVTIPLRREANNGEGSPS